MVVAVGLGERQRHTVVGEEHDQGVVGELRLVELLEDSSCDAVCPAHGSVVLGHLGLDLIQGRQEARHRDVPGLVGVLDLGKIRRLPFLIRVGLFPRTLLPAFGEGTMRVLRVGHQEEGLAGGLGGAEEFS